MLRAIHAIRSAFSRDSAAPSEEPAKNAVRGNEARAASEALVSDDGHFPQALPMRVEACKAGCYWSPAGNRAIRLNGVASFAVPRATVLNGKVHCRHLAMEWARSFFASGAHKRDYERFQSPEAISRHVSPCTEDAYRAAMRNAPAYVVARAEWGDLIARLFDGMRNAGTAASVLLTMTNMHAMAIGLKIKEKGFVVKFYDPVFTACHRRLRLDSLPAVRGAVGNEPAPVADPVAPDALLMLWLQQEDVAALLEGRDIGPRLPGTLSGHLPPFSSDALQHLVELECFDAIDAFMPEFGALDDRRRIEALAPSGGASLMYRAMSGGRVGTLSVFRQLVAGLPVDGCLRVIVGPNVTDTPALAGAMLLGQTSMLRPYWKLVQDCLPAASHDKVMRASCADGTPGLYHVMAGGHARALAACIEAYAPDMDPALLATLLLARAPTGRYGIVTAIQRNHAAVVQAFESGLAGLPDAIAADLVQTVWAQVEAVRAGNVGEPNLAYRTMEGIVGQQASRFASDRMPNRLF